MRALNAFEGASVVHELPRFTGRLGAHLVDSSPFDSPTSHIASAISGQPRLSKIKNQPVQFPGAVIGSLPYEAFGYGLGLVCDTQVHISFLTVA